MATRQKQPAAPVDRRSVTEHLDDVLPRIDLPQGAYAASVIACATPLDLLTLARNKHVASVLLGRLSDTVAVVDPEGMPELEARLLRAEIAAAWEDAP